MRKKRWLIVSGSFLQNVHVFEFTIPILKSKELLPIILCRMRN